MIERIFNGKVEFTLDEVFGIAKCEFHKIIMEIIKRKQQSLEDAATIKAQGVRVDEDEGSEGVC